ncbi:MAG: GntR family transcriptional regulator [Thermoguttaceae bacterium]
MFIHIDLASELPIYDQIVRQLKFAVADQAILPGELAPSVRELARELTVNPNTVARAYRQLQADGVLQSVRGTGLSVAQGAPQQCQAERVILIRNRLRQVLLEARHSRLNGASLRELVEEELAGIEHPEGGDKS